MALILTLFIIDLDWLYYFPNIMEFLTSRDDGALVRLTVATYFILVEQFGYLIALLRE